MSFNLKKKGVRFEIPGHGENTWVELQPLTRGDFQEIRWGSFVVGEAGAKRFDVVESQKISAEHEYECLIGWSGFSENGKVIESKKENRKKIFHDFGSLPLPEWKEGYKGEKKDIPGDLYDFITSKIMKLENFLDSTENLSSTSLQD